MILLHAWVGLQKWQMSWSPPGEQSSRPGIKKWQLSEMGTCGIWKTPRIQRSYVNGHRLPQGLQITILDRRSTLATESRISSLMPCMFDNLAPCCRLMWDRNQSFMLDPSPTKDFRTNISTSFRKDVSRCWKQLLFVQGNWQGSQTELVKTCQCRCLADTPSKAWTWAFHVMQLASLDSFCQQLKQSLQSSWKMVKSVGTPIKQLQRSFPVLAPLHCHYIQYLGRIGSHLSL